MAIIAVTGADGQLGRELRDLSRSFTGYQFLFSDRDTLDITSHEEVNKYVTANNPNWIINCAGYTAVDRAEDEQEAAFLVNQTGVAALVNAIQGTGCRLIHISTDYLFDGRSNRPYREEDEVNPLTIYGKSKLAGEKEALKFQHTIIIRTSWLYSAYGHNFVKTMLRLLNEGAEPTVVYDQTGSPTWAAGLARSVMTIIAGVIRGSRPFIPGLYHYSDEGVCSWYDIAVTIASLTGRETIVTPCLSEQFVQRAPRPAYSVLDKQKIKERYNIPVYHWRDNLVKCLEQIKNRDHEQLQH